MARNLGAELSTVAWSGKGVVSNYGSGGNELIPIVYDRVVPTEKRSLWSFAPQAQLVLINLSTNDFSADTDPTEAAFVAGYDALLIDIRSKHPAAYILCTVGPMLTGTDRTAKARPYIASAGAARRATGDLNVETYEMTPPNPNPGCDSHPSLLTHQAMATELETKVAPRLGGRASLSRFAPQKPGHSCGTSADRLDFPRAPPIRYDFRRRTKGASFHSTREGERTE